MYFLLCWHLPAINLPFINIKIRCSTSGQNKLALPFPWSLPIYVLSLVSPTANSSGLSAICTLWSSLSPSVTSPKYYHQNQMRTSWKLKMEHTGKRKNFGPRPEVSTTVPCVFPRKLIKHRFYQLKGKKKQYKKKTFLA